MTTPTDSPGPEHVPGQLDLLTPHERQLIENPAYSPEFRRQLESELLQARDEQRRLTSLMEESRLRALDRVRDITRTYAETREQLDAAVARARQMDATWQQIADATGMTRQSAWRRWRQPEETEEP